MATLLLQAAGAFLGGFLGPIGATVGTAVGAFAGYAIDRALISSTQRFEGPRLAGPRPFTGEEGASLPRLYGTLRIGGTLIWATRFEEVRTKRRQGAKGGPKIIEYSYFANVAFALCEGEIAGIRRVWADGREIDREAIEIRVYNGSEDQLPDPLIEAKQGIGHAPAYRGTAYVVIEHFALADYGNRVPQLQFEVLRPVGDLRQRIKAVSLIPGATEYGLAPGAVTQVKRLGETENINRHVLHARSDLVAALDELQMICPNLEHVALVATWFGDDLRAGNCRIRPAVTTADGGGLSQAWRVSGIDRGAATVVSTHGGGAAYGGSPSDRSLMDAIAEIKARGLKVTLYPFVMMDIPAGNTLPNPYGGSGQPAYPWRGRMTCHPAPLQPGTADRTATARTQVEAFCGTAEPGDFSGGGDTILFSGSPGDWGYRRFLLHFARLAVAAGGVDAFLIGSELRGLTTLRDAADAFPFVEALCDLAADVRGVVGPDTAITYGADWSEYFGHHPADGSGDLFFHLDALWAHPAIDAVGIDNYMPLSDWRDQDYAGGNPDGAMQPYEVETLRAAISGGEGFDWYYASDAARSARERSPIDDGAYGKPWVFRYKDIVGWWSNPHHNRVAGVEVPAATTWVPKSKPIWLTELGCPAVDKGPNQPNVFPDAKSTENALPYFSSGGRSDIAMLRFLEAHYGHWDEAAPDFDADGNPLSPVYGGRMLDASRIYAWAWDARPFPAFPLRTDRWADGGNWHYGHWLNGRLANPTTGDLIAAILADHGLPPADVSGADGTVAGYIIADPDSVRSAVEPIVDLFDLTVFESGGKLAFRTMGGAGPAAPVEAVDLVSGEEAVLETVRAPDHQLPTEAMLAFRDPFIDHQAGTARVVRADTDGLRQHANGFPGALEPGQASALLEDWLRRVWFRREQVTFSLAHSGEEVGPGSIVALQRGDWADEFIVDQVEDGAARRILARQISRAAPAPWISENPQSIAPAAPLVGLPLAIFCDLPAVSSGVGAEERFRVAVWRKPWRSHVVFASPETTGYTQRSSAARQATVGRLTVALAPGVVGRLDRVNEIEVELFDGEAASISDLQLFNGGNAAAVRAANGVWEVLQFQNAEEISPDIWRLSGLLRGQLGTDDAVAAGAAAGADFVMLDDAVQAAGLLPGEIGLSLNWRVGASGADFSDANFTTVVATGGVRARLPLSPVHLRADWTTGGDVLLSWVRRGRLDADDWAAAEIPLGEEREEYRVEIAAAGGATVRTTTSVEPQWLYDAAAITADFGTVPAEIDLTVRQFSAAAGWGLPAIRRLSLT